VVEPSPARAVAPAQRVEPSVDPRVLMRAAVDEALAPVQQAFRDINRRIDELERRPLAAAPMAAPATAPSPAASAGPQAIAPPPYRPPQATFPGPGGSMAPIPISVASLAPGAPSLAPRPPVLDVAAIERDASVTIDGAIDGRRRKLRLALTFVLLLLLVFGGLFAALAYSYAPHPSSLAPTRTGSVSVSLARAPLARKPAGLVTLDASTAWLVGWR
jgi:hypothetical protein